MAYLNPFTPSFGIVPAVFAGRDVLLAEMAKAFEHGLGDPNLATVIIGARGSGKTALLSCIGDVARQAGWLVVDAVAGPGMLEDILEQTGSVAEHIIEPPGLRRLTGVNIGQVVGLEWETRASDIGNWRTRMSAILDKLAESETGLLLTVDEVDPKVEELVRLVSTYQLFVRERRLVALAMAGLPKNAADLADDDRITFLRRARKRHLGLLPDSEVARALRQSFEGTGKEIPEGIVDRAVEEIGGFPYMLQLVGYNIWAESGESRVVSEGQFARGIEMARVEFKENVLRSTVRDMSKGDLVFAQAMLPDEGSSRLGEVAKRMGKGVNYASTYKTRLLKQGVIDEDGHGGFSFSIPHIKDYLGSQFAD